MDEMLDLDQIQEIIDKFTEMITIANRQGRVSEILDKFNIDTQQYAACEYKIAKVLVIGYSQVNIADLKRVVRNFKLDEDRFEFVLEESAIKNYPMDSLKNNYKYSDIFMGPMPHKTTGMGDCSSVIANIKNHPSEYPKLTELKDSGGLKISKKSFSEAIANSELLKNLSK